MKMLLLGVCLMLLLAGFAAAALMSDDLQIGKIRIGDNGYVSGGVMDTYVYVHNSNPDYSARDGRVTVTIIDEGIYGSSSDFNLKPGKSSGQTVYTELYDVDPGEYLVKVSYVADGVHKTRYRYVIVE